MALYERKCQRTTNTGAVLQDEELYQLLVIADTLRLGRAREREIAIEELTKHINRYVENQ